MTSFACWLNEVLLEVAECHVPLETLEVAFNHRSVHFLPLLVLQILAHFQNIPPVNNKGPHFDKFTKIQKTET